ncbi:chloramphenicol O-acetyltransferase type A [Stackebrandtia endophytica]|uniref:Chloramphenicol acetyltransferase n=1 Tax=Stackebrandtia endophytica TaxID=1496996 RepID=A0A543AYF4_9ACTN|nr:type A chloramphenicol O-acetyltransferase [Stackebrandtia endophytica]TQL77614.1 chloramphenicol O-acetyltransferase type A [Stackebrandtia endophytica]
MTEHTHDDHRPVSIPIPLDTWPRREHFEHYRHTSPCTYAMTVELDVTAFIEALRESGRKTYIAQIWALATVVNRHDAFKMCLTEDGNPGLWQVINPAFTVLNRRTETFACVWAPYDSDFTAFHDVAASLLERHADATRFFPQGDLPANVFDVSSIPWTSFTGFTLNIRDGWEHLAPIFTIGKYVERDDRTLLPLSVQIHHAAADGFHTAKLLNELQDLLTHPDWLNRPE